MKNFLQNLKTSNKIVFLFSFFNFIWLFILLFAINIIYFFIWYSDQQKESWYDMNINYNNLIEEKASKNVEAFKKYILKKNTLILPKDWWKLICSDWVAKTLHNNKRMLEKIKKSLFYDNWDRIYFIYSKTYPEIWEVKVLFDTTPYVKSQIIIIKISLFIILFSVFIFYFLWKKITKYSFKNLVHIAQKVKNLDIEKDFKTLEFEWSKEDEINILASTLNDSFCHIKDQTNNLKQFITDVSHEFKTPLMVMNSEIDLYNKKLEKNKLDKKDSEILLKNIKEKIKKLNNLLETFLFLSRVENKIEKLEKKKILFSNYLENLTLKYIENNEIIKNVWMENIDIKFQIEKNIFLNIEENTFNILFWNLISNAIKFSKININNWKKIKLEIWLNKNTFWIEDNWIWIDKNNISSIFNKFARNNKNIEWFWVWLFLVKRLVSLYDWKIEVESKKAEWTIFIINYNK